MLTVSQKPSLHRLRTIIILSCFFLETGQCFGKIGFGTFAFSQIALGKGELLKQRYAGIGITDYQTIQQFTGDQQRSTFPLALPSEFNLLWHDGRYAITGSKLPDIELAIIRLGNNQSLSHEIAELPNTIEVFNLFDQKIALMEVIDRAQLNTIAEQAHLHGPGCGKIEIIPKGFKLVQSENLPGPVHHEQITMEKVVNAISQVDTNKMLESITALTNLGTRHSSSDQAQNASDKVAELYEASASGISGATVTKKSLANYNTNQQNVIATIPGTENSQPLVIIGAHLDSTHFQGIITDAPGADDDASGIAVQVEVMRIIAEQGLTFQRTIEFHGYAAEEIGLWGSDDLATSYQNQSKSVAGMLQLDMTAYSNTPNDQTIWLADNQTSATLRRSLKDLMTIYMGGNWMEATLTAGTSDHRSWNRIGFPAVFPFENINKHNPYIHTSQDTLANINNISLSGRFAQLTIAFLAHYAGLNETSNTTVNDVLSAKNPDITVAIISAESTGSYQLAVSSIDGIELVEVCKVTANNSPGCLSEIQTLPYAGIQNGRKVFYDSSATYSMNTDDTWRLAGYDDQNKLISSRQIKLSSK